MDNYEYLPTEILFQIIIKLPVRSLVRFRCVSKFWYSRIGKFKFMLSHLQHNKESGNYDVLFRKYCQDCRMENYSLHSDNQMFPEIKTLDFPFQCWSSYLTYFSIVGCVNGVICLWGEKLKMLILWNPSIRKYMTIPKFELEPPMKLGKKMRADWNPVVVHDMCFGLGFDAVSNEFKVVRIILYKDNLEWLNRELVSSVSVLSLGRKTWRKLDYDALFEMHSRSCNVGGFVYRLTSAIGERRLKIVSFDLSTEVFAGIACPDEARFAMDSLPELTIFRDSLALLYEWDKKRYHIWVMKEDGGVDKSWMKFFSVDLDVVVRVPEQRIVGFSMKGLMLVVGEGNVVVSPVVEDVEVVKYVPPCLESAWHVESYVESLALLKEGEINHQIWLCEAGRGWIERLLRAFKSPTNVVSSTAFRSQEHLMPCTSTQITL